MSCVVRGTCRSTLSNKGRGVKLMTAVIYAHYSSDNQREGSIEGQIRERTAYAEKNGITVIKHYIDRALAAKTDNRLNFRQMIKDSEKPAV